MDWKTALAADRAPGALRPALVLLFALAAARPGLAADCNGNGVSDALDLATGTSGDCNADGVPDECEALPILGTTGLSIKRHDDFEPHMTFLADLDGDGRLDLTTMDGEFRVMVLRNQGDGTMGNETIFDLRDGDECLAITPADLDGDGRLDIAAVDERTNYLLVLVNRGGGTFVQTDQSARTGTRPYFDVAADFDGDGDLDVATANEQADSVGIFRNRGDATFDNQVSLTVGEGPVGLVAADFDGDGDPDLAVGSSGDSEVSILRNDGKANFGGRADHRSNPVSYLSGSDLDGDGDLDLIAASGPESSITTLRAIGGGAFEIMETLAVGQPPRSAIAADLDRDGLPEIVTGNEETDTMSILRGIGGGSFGAPTHFAVGRDPRFVVAGDLDADGNVDLVVANHTSFSFTFFFNETTSSRAPRERICTALEYFRLAAPLTASGGYVELEMPYLVPAKANPSLLPTTFLPAEPGRPAWEALAALFPQKFGGLDAGGYQALVARRATRQYYTGNVLRLRLSGQVLWGFTVITDGAPSEGITAGEAAAVYHALDTAFLLEPFAYFPDTADARANARSWTDPGFPVVIQDPSVQFQRGDVNLNGAVNISDAIEILEGLFVRGTIPCDDAADANDDGQVDISDPFIVLLHLFGSVGDLPAPSRACGPDPTDDALACFQAPACR